jgi:hypothetical protein
MKINKETLVCDLDEYREAISKCAVCGKDLCELHTYNLDFNGDNMHSRQSFCGSCGLVTWHKILNLLMGEQCY